MSDCWGKYGLLTFEEFWKRHDQERRIWIRAYKIAEASKVALGRFTDEEIQEMIIDLDKWYQRLNEKNPELHLKYG